MGVEVCSKETILIQYGSLRKIISWQISLPQEVWVKNFQIVGSTGTEKCRFFIYDIRYNVCELYNETIVHHESTCQFIGGPPLPSVDKCDIKDCSVR